MIEALSKEIALRRDYLEGKTLDTIYFGGGTPGLIPPKDIETLLDAIRLNFTVNPGAEITLEVNPENITVSALTAWKQCGVNRLSIGVQSLFDEELTWMNRSHNSVHALQCVNLALDTGFSDLSVDLIFGGPLLTHTQWEKQLEWAFNSGVNHISAYALTIEPKTPLDKMMKKGNAIPLSDEKQSEQYKTLYHFAEQQGWDFYEISNLSKKGHRARHNSAYWAGKPYLGIGPSAHSYNIETRSWNIASIEGYINGINKGELPLETELLDPVTRINEILMTTIRTIEGIDLDAILFMDKEWLIKKQDLIERFSKNDWVSTGNNRLKLSVEGRLMADHITAELFS